MNNPMGNQNILGENHLSMSTMKPFMLLRSLQKSLLSLDILEKLGNIVV